MFEQLDGSKLNASASDTGVLASFFNSLLVKKSTGAAGGPDGKPAGKYCIYCTCCYENSPNAFLFLLFHLFIYFPRYNKHYVS